MDVSTFIADCGLEFTPVFDSGLHRFSRGHRKDESGWHISHRILDKEDIYIVIWGDWATGEMHKLCSKKKFTDSASRIRIEGKIAEMEAAQARARAVMFERAKDVTEAVMSNPNFTGLDFPYLVKKLIPQTFGAVLSSYKGEDFLGIPLRDSTGALSGMQKIFADGSKRFIPGSKVQGSFFPIGAIGERVFICEGFATGVSIHLATGCGVAVAFNAGNLEAVGNVIRERFSGVEIVIAGDEDLWTVRGGQPWNPGREFATHAAKKISSAAVFPKFKDLDGKPTDWNDLHCREGLAVVKEQLGHLVPDLKTRFPTLKTNFYWKYVDDKGNVHSKPDYTGLGEYFRDELHLVSNSGYMFIYEGGKYEPICKLGLGNRIMLQTKNEVRAEHLDRFVAQVRTMTFAKSAVMAVPDGMINLANGVLNVRDRKLLPHSPEYFFKYQLEHAYDQFAGCPRWLEWLDYIFEGNKELVNLSAEIFGYALLGGEPFLHKAFLLYGDGRNGKSTWLEVLTALLGRSNVSAVSMSMLDKPFSVVSLDGKLANIKGESPNDVVSSEAFKGAVGGEYLTAAHKGSAEYELKIEARLFFATNDLPRFNDTTIGAFEKLCIIPFARYIRPEERRWAVASELITEAPGILNWALDGLDRLLERGALPETGVIDEMLEEYREESDSVFAWTKERTVLDPTGEWILVKTLYGSYASYCESNGRPVVNMLTFGKRIRRIVIAQFGKDSVKKTKQGIKARGIKLDGAANQTPFKF